MFQEMVVDLDQDQEMAKSPLKSDDAAAKEPLQNDAIENAIQAPQISDEKNEVDDQPMASENQDH